MRTPSVFGRVVLFLAWLLTPAKRGSYVLQTPNGALEGYTLTSRSGRTIIAFSGVPYGRPPVGPLRFKDPQPAEPWKGLKSAKRNIKCVEYQFIFPLSTLRYADGEEDCLALSIYTHDTKPEALKPVMFYIHGGCFEFRLPPGSWQNPTFFMDHDIVVVVVSYRLSVLGFLSFEDDVQPGNMGLKDQNLALKWVYENIQHFGGDPNRITSVGESAGAASTHFHAMMPKSRDMIRGAIMQSGFVYSNWAYDPPGEARKLALSFAGVAGCNKSTTEETLDCLRGINAYDLVAYTDEFRMWWDRDPLVLFKPVTEKPGPNAFITGTPKEWPPVTVPVLTGVGAEDDMLEANYDFTKMNKNLKLFLPKAFWFNSQYTTDVNGTLDKMLNYFFGRQREFSRLDEKKFSQFYSEVLFRFPMAVSIQDMTNDVFLYINSFVSDKIYFVKHRVFHVQELFFLWELEAMPNALRGPDLKFSESIVKKWADFVIYGNPNGKGKKLWKNLWNRPRKLNGSKRLHTSLQHIETFSWQVIIIVVATWDNSTWDTSHKSNSVFPKGLRPTMSDLPYVYRLTVSWFAPIVVVLVIVVGVVVSYLTGFNRLEDVNPDLIAPMARRFLPKKPKAYAPVPLEIITKSTEEDSPVTKS